MNLIESIFEAVTDPAPAPMHAGEVMTLWTYAVAIDEGRALCLFMLNHTEDVDLKRLMEHFVKHVEEPARDRIHKFLVNEGISLPPTTSDKGKASANAIPSGARLTDAEVANMFLAKVIAGLQVLGNGLIVSLRHDVAQMLYSFQAQLLKEGFVLKQTMTKRGWLKTPPIFAVSKDAEAVH